MCRCNKSMLVYMYTCVSSIAQITCLAKQVTENHVTYQLMPVMCCEYSVPKCLPILFFFFFQGGLVTKLTIFLDLWALQRN